MPEEAPPLFNVQIDGVWHQFPKGTRVIEACEKAGSYVPRYCYHKKLSSPGNCRMCLIEMGMPKMGPDRKPELGEDGKPLINWMPRPQISCAQDVADGMGVRTNSPLVRECQRGVMEFLLINHPLDCPICDQAGECRLQEFSVEYGNASSRFLENKVKKPKAVELGPRVRTLNNINEFYAHESCGQCTPCREGSLWMKKITDRMMAGGGVVDDPNTLTTVANNIAGRTICAFGEACAWPTQSFVDKFPEEFGYRAFKSPPPPLPPEYTPEELIEENQIPTTPLARDPGWEKAGSAGTI